MWRPSREESDSCQKQNLQTVKKNQKLRDKQLIKYVGYNDFFGWFRTA
jgi:hypothetical protein